MTLREHLEAIRDQTAFSEGTVSAQRTLHAHAVAALKALDEATRYEGVVFYPWGAPPSEPMRARLVPDPAPPTENT